MRARAVAAATTRALGTIVPILPAAVAAGRCGRHSALCRTSGGDGALVSSGSRKRSRKITIFVVEGLLFGREVVFIVRGLAARFFGKEVVERAPGPLVSTNRFDLCGQAFGIGCSLDFDHRKRGRQLAVVEAEKEARDENSLAGSVGMIGMRFENEQARAVHILRNGLVAGLSQTREGVQVRSGKVGLIKYLDELLPEG